MWLYEKPIAHRGLHNESMTENSMSAFKNAIEKGYNIETDVHLLKSGEVVIFHDNTLKRVCGKPNKISSLTLDDIKGDNYLLPNGEHIPLFSELMEICEGRTGILLELKLNGFNYDLEKAVLKLVQGKENYIAVQAFNPFTVQWFKNNAPEFHRGVLSSIQCLSFDKILMKKMKPDFIAYDVNTLPSVVKTVNKYNLNLLSWTVRSVANIKKAIDNKVNNIIFEKVDLVEEKFNTADLKPLD